MQLNSNSSFIGFKTPNYARGKVKPKSETDGAMSSIVTTLPGAELRFLKIRRTGDMRNRVAISYYQERLMRRIFTDLDFAKMGVLTQEELKGASKYVENRMESMSTTRGLFKNIHEEFAAMDTDGDGFIDYNEFTIAMTGTTKGLLERVTESEMDMMTFCYVEYAQIKKRKQILKMLKETKKDNNKLGSVNMNDAGFSTNPNPNPSPNHSPSSSGRDSTGRRSLGQVEATPLDAER
jgi:hypothetical protein